MSIKILTVVGARPQFVKASMISTAIEQLDDVSEFLVHTGQHFDSEMNDIFFEQMGIPLPDVNLGVQSSLHGEMTAMMLKRLEELMIGNKPDKVLVYGDTNSTLAGALAASKLHVPIVHVEAGLRSFNMKMPEEVNRVITDRLSQYLLCPTDTAVKNLENEGFDSMPVMISNVGDVMQDVAFKYSAKAFCPDSLLGVKSDGFVLATLHRAENTDSREKLFEIVTALNEIHSETPVVLPVHPRTAQKLKVFDLKCEFRIIPPVSYFEMLWLLENCSLVMTDSGGLQKEAYFFRRPCVTLRDETEWTELVELGVNRLVGSSFPAIINGVESMLGVSFKSKSSLYGGGKAVQRIVKILAS